MYARSTLVEPQCTALQTDGQTDRQTDEQAAANSRSYCVAVRSAKN